MMNAVDKKIIRKEGRAKVLAWKANQESSSTSSAASSKSPGSGGRSIRSKNTPALRGKRSSVERSEKERLKQEGRAKVLAYKVAYQQQQRADGIRNRHTTLADAHVDDSHTVKNSSLRRQKQPCSTFPQWKTKEESIKKDSCNSSSSSNNNNNKKNDNACCVYLVMHQKLPTDSMYFNPVSEPIKTVNAKCVGVYQTKRGGQEAARDYFFDHLGYLDNGEGKNVHGYYMPASARHGKVRCMSGRTWDEEVYVQEMEIVLSAV